MFGVPPVAGTLFSGELMPSAKSIVPLRFQVPPRPAGASASTVRVLLYTSMTLSLPAAKNPTLRLSAAQNGNAAPSFPEGLAT
jgi:hypothetical protein